jgi:hypothetical protein
MHAVFMGSSRILQDRRKYHEQPNLLLRNSMIISFTLEHVKTFTLQRDYVLVACNGLSFW